MVTLTRKVISLGIFAAACLIMGGAGYYTGISYSAVGNPVVGGVLGVLVFFCGIILVANGVTKWIWLDPEQRPERRR